MTDPLATILVADPVRDTTGTERLARRMRHAGDGIEAACNRLAAAWDAGAEERAAKRAEINAHFDRHHASRPMPWEVQ